MIQITIKLVNYTDKLAEIRAVRVQVFQIEQGIDPALEFDGNDETAIHILAYLDNQPVGTTRIRYLNNQTAKIERLAVLAEARGQGIGKQLMVKALEVVAQNQIKEVIVHAQAHVKNLYHKLGFKQDGEEFEEAGILHVKMKKSLS